MLILMTKRQLSARKIDFVGWGMGKAKCCNLCNLGCGKATLHTTKAYNKQTAKKSHRPSDNGFFKISGVPTGIRTPVTAVKGRCPRPLDDGDAIARGALSRLNSGGAKRSRTADPLHAMQVLYQLSYSPIFGNYLDCFA